MRKIVAAATAIAFLAVGTGSASAGGMWRCYDQNNTPCLCYKLPNGNIAMVYQHGNYNNSAITQKGYGNFAGVKQRGHYNRSTINQTGNNNDAYVMQRGNNNTSTINQSNW